MAAYWAVFTESLHISLQYLCGNCFPSTGSANNLSLILQFDFNCPMLYTIWSWVFSGLTDAPVFFECFPWSPPKIEVQAAQCGDLVVQKVHLRTSQVGHGNPFGARAKKRINVDGEVVQQRQDILIPQLLLAAAPRNISVF